MCVGTLVLKSLFRKLSRSALLILFVIGCSIFFLETTMLRTPINAVQCSALVFASGAQHGWILEVSELPRCGMSATMSTASAPTSEFRSLSKASSTASGCIMSMFRRMFFYQHLQLVTLKVLKLTAQGLAEVGRRLHHVRLVLYMGRHRYIHANDTRNQNC